MLSDAASQAFLVSGISTGLTSQSVTWYGGRLTCLVHPHASTLKLSTRNPGSVNQPLDRHVVWSFSSEMHF